MTHKTRFTAKIALPIFMSIFLLGTSCRADVTFEDLFHFPAAEAERTLGATRHRQLEDALEDFNAALNYKVPPHATFDEKAGLPADGGTRYYKGRGYQITVVKSLFSMGEGKQRIHGFLYGPVLTLAPELGSGNDDSLSRISFYPVDTLNKLLK